MQDIFEIEEFEREKICLKGTSSKQDIKKFNPKVMSEKQINELKIKSYKEEL